MIKFVFSGSTQLQGSSVATENVIPTENVIHYIFGYYIFGYDLPTENVITENVISPIIKEKVAKY